MQQEFQEHIIKHKLFSLSDKILLAVSGGIDSVVMLDLFSSMGIEIGIAHCNFGLRGHESDGDEEFVSAIARKYNVRFFVKHFDASAYADKNNISIQMAARDLRYEWFEEIRKKEKYKYIAFAHNADDVIETILINFARGTGISGLRGIPVKRDKFIRPLLFAMRKEIGEYAKENQLQFREDSSNAGDKYIRNKLRHHVVPVLKEINPSLNSSVAKMTEHIIEAEQLIASQIDRVAKKIVKKQKNKTVIAIAELKQLSPLNLYLHELLKGFGFDAAVIAGLAGNISRLKTGKQFLSAKYRLLIDRKKMIITAVHAKKQAVHHRIKKGTSGIKIPLEIKFNTISDISTFSIVKDPATACLDMNKLKFPLQMRKWNPGDKFKPLGMTGFKKLSDFFTDAKMSLLDKEDQWLLVSGNDIVWVIGKRIDDRYKVTPKTGRVFVCELK